MFCCKKKISWRKIRNSFTEKEQNLKKKNKEENAKNKGIKDRTKLWKHTKNFN